MEADEKECPFCAETIKAKAKICKHCRSELPQEQGNVEHSTVYTEPVVVQVGMDEIYETPAAEPVASISASNYADASTATPTVPTRPPPSYSDISPAQPRTERPASAPRPSAARQQTASNTPPRQPSRNTSRPTPRKADAQDDPNKKIVIVMWICVFLAFFFFLTPIPLSGIAAWPVNIAAFVLAIISLTRYKVLHGILGLICTTIGAAVVNFTGILISILVWIYAILGVAGPLPPDHGIASPPPVVDVDALDNERATFNKFDARHAKYDISASDDIIKKVKSVIDKTPIFEGTYRYGGRSEKIIFGFDVMPSGYIVGAILDPDTPPSLMMKTFVGRVSDIPGSPIILITERWSGPPPDTHTNSVQRDWMMHGATHRIEFNLSGNKLTGKSGNNATFSLSPADGTEDIVTNSPRTPSGTGSAPGMGTAQYDTPQRPEPTIQDIAKQVMTVVGNDSVFRGTYLLNNQAGEIGIRFKEVSATGFMSGILFDPRDPTREKTFTGVLSTTIGSPIILTTDKGSGVQGNQAATPVQRDWLASDKSHRLEFDVRGGALSGKYGSGASFDLIPGSLDEVKDAIAKASAEREKRAAQLRDKFQGGTFYIGNWRKGNEAGEIGFIFAKSDGVIVNGSCFDPADAAKSREFTGSLNLTDSSTQWPTTVDMARSGLSGADVTNKTRRYLLAENVRFNIQLTSKGAGIVGRTSNGYEIELRELSKAEFGKLVAEGKARTDEQRGRKLAAFSPNTRYIGTWTSGVDAEQLGIVFTGLGNENVTATGYFFDPSAPSVRKNFTASIIFNENEKWDIKLTTQKPGNGDRTANKTQRYLLNDGPSYNVFLKITDGILEGDIDRIPRYKVKFQKK